MLSQVHSYLFWAVQTNNNILGIESAEKFLFSLLVISGYNGCETQEISFYQENIF